MIYVALRMLFRDRAKSILLLCAISFATILMAQQSAIFIGLLRWGTAMLRNTKATIWVVDRNSTQVNEVKNIRDIELSRVRSVEGVHWAMPMSFAIIQAKMPSGFFKNIQLIGLDSSTLAGHPTQIKQGSIFDMLNDKAVMIDNEAISRLSENPDKPIGIGSTFEINDREARVVAICQTERNFFGYPYVYTTYGQATSYTPPQRNMLSYILVEPVPGLDPEIVAKRIKTQTGLNAYLEDEFSYKTILWLFKNTGIPVAMGFTVILGFIFGVAVTGQTFYAFILENIPNFAVLKAMGAKTRTLYQMMIVQATLVGIMGYGFGMAIVGIFGHLIAKRRQPPFYLDPAILVITFFAICIICYISVLIAGKKVEKVEPAQVFRS